MQYIIALAFLLGLVCAAVFALAGDADEPEQDDKEDFQNYRERLES